MEMTIPFALSWGAVLTAVSAGVAVYEKRKNGKTTEEKSEDTK